MKVWDCALQCYDRRLLAESRRGTAGSERPFAVGTRGGRGEIHLLLVLVGVVGVTVIGFLCYLAKPEVGYPRLTRAPHSSARSANPPRRDARKHLAGRHVVNDRRSHPDQGAGADPHALPHRRVRSDVAVRADVHAA